MSNLFHRMTRKRRAQTNGEVSPEERQAQFLREHEARMRRVDEAITEAKRSSKQRSPEADRPASA